MIDTSAAAKKSLDTKSIERKVYSYISRWRSGVTCDEVEVALNLRHQTCSARFTALKKKGEIMDSGKTRKTRSGRSAKVWTISEKGNPEQIRLL